MQRIFEIVVIVLFVGVLVALAAAVQGCAHRTPAPPPEPPIVITIGDASISDDCIAASYQILDALQCPESMGDPKLFADMARELGSDFDFCAIARCHDSECLHVAHVRCEMIP